MSLPFQFLGLYRPSPNPGTHDDDFENQLCTLAGAPLYRDERFALFGADEDRWPGSTLRLGDKQVTLILGEPLLVEGNAPLPRAEALTRFASSLDQGQSTALNNAHGSYCGLHYHREQGTLHLFTDKIGLRGLFVADLGSVIIFASSPSPFMRLVEPHSQADETGLAETIAFGHPLGDRTRLQACKRLLEAEVMLCTPTANARRHYHQWNATIDYTLSLEAAADRIHGEFVQAVRDRLAISSSHMPFAFLSGGMDSRLIVSALCAAERRPITLNVAPQATQDALLGQAAADFFGTLHHAIPATTVWLAQSIDDGVRDVCLQHPDLPGSLWWSGDGGSVGLGHVYLTEATSPATETPPEDIARALINHNNWRISERVLKRNWRHLCALPHAGIVEELQRHSHLPPEKRAYAFLLFNNQRRHLDFHFSTLDTRAHDLVLPFFDDRFLQAVLETPIEHLLNHRLYNTLFARHLPPTHNVAWQAYPGHEPCPHPPPSNGRYQWDGWGDASSIREAQRDAARQAFRRLRRGESAPQTSKLAVAAASLLTYYGVRDMRYVLKTATALAQAIPRRAQRTPQE